MTKKPRPKQDDPEQSKRFVETAKDVGAATDSAAFEAAFKKVAPKAAAKGRSPTRS